MLMSGRVSTFGRFFVVHVGKYTVVPWLFDGFIESIKLRFEENLVQNMTSYSEEFHFM